MSYEKGGKGITPEQFVAKYRKLQNQKERQALEGINKIDWSKLHHAHGEANDFPVLLFATFSDNEHDREFAFRLLFETIWHQGTVYEASAQAVPFLFQALESPEMQDKVSMAVLLASLADGHSYLQVHAADDKSKKIWRQILAKKNQELEVQINIEVEHVNSTRKAVGKRLHLLYPFLQDEYAAGEIAKALAVYPEHKAETIPLLEIAQKTIQDEFSKKEIQSALDQLRESNEV